VISKIPQDNGEDAKQYYAEHYPQVGRSQPPERRCEQQDHEEQETGARYQRAMLGIAVVEVDSGTIQTRLENGKESRVIAEGEYDAGTECQQHDEDAPRFPFQPIGDTDEEEEVSQRLQRRVFERIVVNIILGRQPA
jgi:hypothetical protein